MQPKSIPTSTLRLLSRTFMLMLVLSGVGCTHSTQAYFSSPEAAADDLIQATRNGNTERLREIFGPNADQLLNAADPVAARASRDRFIAAVDEKYELVDEPDGSVTLRAGPNDFVFPIPLVLGEGGWIFDTKTGLNEVINRRVGENESNAVEVCKAIVDAEQEYLLLDPDGDNIVEYAQKFFSDPGKRNGLYWPTAEGEALSPMGDLVAYAASEGYRRDLANPEAPTPYHGYVYRILRAQGEDAPGGVLNYMIGDRMIAGFAVVAYPAIYGNSGVMTFIVNRDGVVHQRDLGAKTAEIAGTMTIYNPSEGWKPVP